MADEPNTDTKPDDKTPDADNLKGELERRKAAQRKAEKELADLRDKLLEFEDRDKTELQRAQERANRAETQLQELGQQVTSLQKGSWVRSAAAEFKFHDPEDAVVNLQSELGSFEDPKEARRAVERLAKSKQHLVRSEEEKPATPRIGQVIRNGQASTEQQLAQMHPAQVAALQERDFAQSLAGELQKFQSQWKTFGGGGS